jgi:peptide deformylase
VQIEADGYLARCFQHEVDHLEGKLYLQRLPGRLRRQALDALR